MLALICGTGQLPRAVALAQKTLPLVCVLDGFAPEGLSADITFRPEHLGRFLNDLKARGVTTICLCGAISRPTIDPTEIEPETLPLVPVLQAAMSQGDDGALRAVIAILHEAGFAVKGASELAPDILPPAGVLSRVLPDEQARIDVNTALRALTKMGEQDLGQACVVRQGQVIAREDARGTDAMLADLADTNAGGILFKAPKPGQERRADLPTIGPDTALSAVRAGVSGIVIEAGGVIVLNLADLVAALDAAGLFLWVREP